MNLLECTANGRLEGNGWTLPEPRASASRATARRCSACARRTCRSTSREESASLDGKVYAVEPLGDRTLVDIEIGDQRVVIKAPPTASCQIGEEVRASVDLDRVHLFDADTESAIATSDDRRPATAGAQAGADPRACPA